MTLDVSKRIAGFLRRAANRLDRDLPIEYPFIDLLDLIVRSYQEHAANDFMFMQIGASDGVSHDPIAHLVRRYRWRGILVEPQPNSFQLLVNNYQGEDQLIFENLLIGREDGTAPFYAVEHVPGLPSWLYQSGSLDRTEVEGALYYWKHGKGLDAIPDDHESLIEELTLPMLTISTLLRKHDIGHLDLLVIDTMGFDFEILKTFPFDTMKPNIIHFEHSLLNREDQVACRQHLASQGYGLAKVAVDTIAYLDAPIRRWPIIGW